MKKYKEYTELQKNTITSIDELIKIQEEKLELLKKHKKGLLQRFNKD